MNIISKPSPNQDSFRLPITTIVIHWIVGNLAAADAVFAKLGGVSAHYAVEDSTVHQYVPENKVAYHAGVYLVNQQSIGIEHSASPDRPASDLTYETSGQLIAEIAKRYNIPLDRAHIKGHKEYKATQCPGTMDIDRLISIAKKYQPNDLQKELDKARLERDANWNKFVTLRDEVKKSINSLSKLLS